MENLPRVGRKFELDQIKANSIQLEPTQAKWVANDTQLHRSCEPGSSWVESGGPFGQGFTFNDQDRERIKYSWCQNCRSQVLADRELRQASPILDNQWSEVLLGQKLQGAASDGPVQGVR